MPKLKLGPLPDDKPVRRTVVFTAEQDALLRAYAAALATQEGATEPPAVERLVPAIVEHFIATDRGFRQRGRER